LRSKAKSLVGPLMDDNDVLISDDQEMRQMLNTFVPSVFTTDIFPEVKLFFMEMKKIN